MHTSPRAIIWLPVTLSFVGPAWLKMPLVTCYKNLLKPNKEGNFQPFNPLRAVGLALELAWKTARDIGQGSVSAERLRQVRVSGQLRLKEGEQWRNARQCTLQLAQADSNLALAVLRKQRRFFSDWDMNVW